MTVKELIELLQDYEPEMEVHIGYDYGDHSHTTVAPGVTAIEELPLRMSEYFQRPIVVDLDDEINGDDTKNALVIQ